MHGIKARSKEAFEVAERFWKGKKLGGKWELATSKALAPHLTCSAPRRDRAAGRGRRCGWTEGAARAAMPRVGPPRAHAASGERGGCAGAASRSARKGGRRLSLTWPAAPFSHLQRQLEKFPCLSLSSDVLIRGRRDEIITEIICICCLEIRIGVAHLFSTEAITPPRGWN